VVVPAVSITRAMPPWVPLSAADARAVFEGQVEVAIDAKGNVTAAAIAAPIYPMYDQQLLAYAKRWKFTPATRNGVPIASIQVVPIRLQTQQGRQ
jgi:TonB family protein